MWKADRDELPSWGTPSVYEGPTGTILFTADGHASGTLWETPVVVDIDHDYSNKHFHIQNNKYIYYDDYDIDNVNHNNYIDHKYN